MGCYDKDNCLYSLLTLFFDIPINPFSLVSRLEQEMNSIPNEFIDDHCLINQHMVS